MKQLAEADSGAAAALVLVTRADAAAGGADGLFSAALFLQALLFQVVRKDDVRVVADDEVIADRNTREAQAGDLFEEARRVNDDAVGNDGPDRRAKHARGQQRELERLAVGDDGVARVGAAVVADHEVVLLGEQIDDLALGLVAPLKADDTGASHERVPRCRAGTRRRACRRRNRQRPGLLWANIKNAWGREATGRQGPSIDHPSLACLRRGVKERLRFAKRKRSVRHATSAATLSRSSAASSGCHKDTPRRARSSRIATFSGVPGTAPVGAWARTVWP